MVSPCNQSVAVLIPHHIGCPHVTDWLHGEIMMMRYQYSYWLVTWGNHDDDVSVQQLTGYMGEMKMRYQYRNWLITWGNHDDEVSVQKLTGYMGEPWWWGISTETDWLHGETMMMRYQYSNWLVTWGNHDDEVSVQQLTGYMGEPRW
jgi:metallophosphoesterase superfamily enzyme